MVVQPSSLAVCLMALLQLPRQQVEPLKNREAHEVKRYRVGELSHYNLSNTPKVSRGSYGRLTFFSAVDVMKNGTHKSVAHLIYNFGADFDATSISKFVSPDQFQSNKTLLKAWF